MNARPLLLIVEDEPLIRLELVFSLESAGFDVAECSRGNDAIAWIDDAEHIQGLITDIRLGQGPDGWELARHARKKFVGLPVVYVTGDSAADWTAYGVPNSVMLQKPYGEAQMLTAIFGLLASMGTLAPQADLSSD